jgi:hypothetical protein
MIYATLALIVLTVLFSVLYRAKILAVCPICAATVLTWISGLALLYSGKSWAPPLVIALLMGASLGAMAERYGKKFGLLWKTAVVVAGAPAIYFLVGKKLVIGLALLAIIVILTLVRSRDKPSQLPKRNKDLFADCC